MYVCMCLLSLPLSLSPPLSVSPSLIQSLSLSLCQSPSLSISHSLALALSSLCLALPRPPSLSLLSLPSRSITCSSFRWPNDKYAAGSREVRLGGLEALLGYAHTRFKVPRTYVYSYASGHLVYCCESVHTKKKTKRSGQVHERFHCFFTCRLCSLLLLIPLCHMHACHK